MSAKSANLRPSNVLPHVTKPAQPPLLRWARRYLREYFCELPSPFHAELLADLAAPGGRLIVRVAPRGHAKSTCAAFAYPLWCVCEQKRRNIVIITHEQSLATQFVRDIRLELETNERLRDCYGDLTLAEIEDPPAPAAAKKKTTARKTSRRKSAGRSRWAATHFVTATGIAVQAKGSGASLRGARVGPHRPDLIICDDLEKDELVRSASQREKLEQWLRRVVLPALAPGGQLVVLGSLLHPDALLAKLCDRQRFPGWDYRVYRAIEAVPRADDPEQFERVALWPARWPLARLDEERGRVGTRAFEQEYQANPVDDSIRVFPPEWLKRYDESELVPQRLVHLMAVDPATGKDAGDYFAVWVGAVDTSSGVIYTRVLSLERINFVAQVQRILDLAARWRPVKIGIETTAYQQALKDNLIEQSHLRGLYLSVVSLDATGSKRVRIEATAPLYANGQFRLPAALDAEVEAQFLHFPNGQYDDAPDVCAMGIALARGFRTLSGFDGQTLRRDGFGRQGW